MSFTVKSYTLDCHLILLVFKPIRIHIAVGLFLALCKKTEHHTSEAAYGLGTKETVFHLSECGKVGTVSAINKSNLNFI